MSFTIAGRSRTGTSLAAALWQALRFGKCRICTRVAVTVFLSILVVEAAILVFSVDNRIRSLMDEAESEGRAAVTTILSAAGGTADPEVVIDLASRLVGRSVLAGGALYGSDGRLAGRFGEAPDLGGGAAPGTRVTKGDGERTDVVWASSEVGGHWRVVGRLDTSSIRSQVTAFVWRVVGLVLVISLFVTLVTMTFLRAAVLGPVLELRRRMMEAGGDGADPEAHLLDLDRRDELGDVAEAFNGMLRRQAEAVSQIRGHQNALRMVNRGLEKKVDARTAELVDLNQALKREMAEREAAQKTIQRLAKFPEENPNPVLRVSADGRVYYGNQPGRALLVSWNTDVDRHLPAEWARMVEDSLRSGHSNEVEDRCGDTVYSLIFQPVQDAGYVNIYGRDITARVEAEARIRHLANHDDLTGLPNRTLFHDRLGQAISQAHRDDANGALLLLDIDHFKDVNDTMGHPAGDALLRAIAGRLSGCLRESDTVARLGGDEFALVMAGVEGPGCVAKLAQKALDSLAEPFVIEGQEVHSGVSIGATLFPGDSQEPEKLLRNADMALYRAKEAGRGAYRFFQVEMDDEVQRARSVERDMRLALERGEFVLHYQPKMSLATGRVSGMEALIRWQHPEQGFMSPAEFIPIAEKNKLIVPIGEWALRTACAQNKAWQDAGLPMVKVAVNLSAVQFREADLAGVVSRVLAETGLDPSCLELEITETAAMDDAEAAIRSFETLSGLGVSLSIDDFGTGYSSLAYLRQFPVRRVKIDKAFVDDLGTVENTGAIARAVTTLGHSFGMEVTAEGVETEAQLAFLKDLGCDEIQGYHYSRPLAAEALESFLRGD